MAAGPQHQDQHHCPLRDALVSTPTHPGGLVLHVDGGDVGSQEQGSPAVYPDSVKVFVVLPGRQRGQDQQLKSLLASLLALHSLPHQTALSKDLSPSLSCTHKCLPFTLCTGSCADARAAKTREGHGV